uniref:Uncharacterized protein n=1 Tax=Arundo donax TaxID=35708 RepID=A0A0A9P9Q4_ARUDO
MLKAKALWGIIASQPLKNSTEQERKKDPRTVAKLEVRIPWCHHSSFIHKLYNFRIILS